MPSPNISELALRTAINTRTSSLNLANDLTDAIKDSALKRMNELVHANGNGTSASEQTLIQSEAIHVAIKVLKVSYSAIQKQLETLKMNRLSFAKESDVVATFWIPLSKETRRLSKEERCITSFLQLASKTPLLAHRMGICSTQMATENAVFHAVLPFYRVSDAINDTLSLSSPLNRQRAAIRLFLKSHLADILNAIISSFKSDSKWSSFWKATLERSNYLNNRRAPCLIMTALANALWDLQQPIDPKTGFPLSLKESIALCRDFIFFLNQLLNHTAPPYLHELDNKENHLLSFLRTMEIHAKALHQAYVEEQLYNLPIRDITINAHRMLRIINKNILKLIYHSEHPTSKKIMPDDRAAEKMAATISTLNQLLIQNKDLLLFFQPYAEHIPNEALLNTPPQTLMDILIILGHLTEDEYKDLIKIIKKTQKDSCIELACTLKKLQEAFVNPIQIIGKQELKKSIMTPKQSKISQWSAIRIIPLFAWVINDYLLKDDIPLLRHQDEASPQDIYHVEQQIQRIQNTTHLSPYYVFDLTSFVPNAISLSPHLDDLIQWQQRLTKVTELLYNIHDIITRYQHLLSNPSFQAFLTSCLRHLKEEYAIIDTKVAAMDAAVGNDVQISRGFQQILRTLISDLNPCLEMLTPAVMHMEHMIQDPHFTQQQRQMLSSKLHKLSTEFSALFTETCPLDTLIPAEPVIVKQLSRSIKLPPIAEQQKLTALKHLVQQCHNALSSQSKKEHKGKLLNQLCEMIERQAETSEEHIRKVILELTRITASYRTTWIFHADYGRTRSAQALIHAIKDPHINQSLPLASIIFNDPSINVLKLTDGQVIKQLQSLKNANQWQTSCENIRLRPL